VQHPGNRKMSPAESSAGSWLYRACLLYRATKGFGKSHPSVFTEAAHPRRPVLRVLISPDGPPAEYVAQVRVHGVRREKQPVGYGLVRQALHGQGSHP
jgi:hypothetical protein